MEEKIIGWVACHPSQGVLLNSADDSEYGCFSSLGYHYDYNDLEEEAFRNSEDFKGWRIRPIAGFAFADEEQ